MKISFEVSNLSYCVDEYHIKIWSCLGLLGYYNKVLIYFS